MKNFVLLDVCPPDYFTGHHLPVLTVPVYKCTTISELIDGINDEYNFCFDFFESEYQEEIFDSALMRLKESNQKVLDNRFLKDEIEIEDFEDGFFAHFVLMDIETIINF